MDSCISKRLIDVFIFDDLNLLDVSGPVQAFANAMSNEAHRYDFRYVSLDGSSVRASCGLVLTPDAALSSKSPATDLLIPGGGGVDALLDNEQLIDHISDWADRKRDKRLISICSGSMLLAAAGVLDGKCATTHWSREAEVKQRFPNVIWDTDKIYILGDRISTSAGVTTGIDLALSIIAKDCGSASALQVAQELVVYLKRSGGQGQFSSFIDNQYHARVDISALVEQIIHNPAGDWTLESMAHEVSMSSRTLSRKFNRQIGVSPVQYVEKIRIDHARNLLCEGIPLATAARVSGFGDMQRMRRGFKRQLGLGIKEYLDRFS